MQRFGDLRVQNALICDDVRREAETGKHILIGTYSGDIVLNGAVPAHMVLGLYFELLVPPGRHEVELQLSGPGKGSGIIKAVIEQPAGERVATLIVPRLEIFMEKAGTFKVDIRAAGGRWQNVIKKSVSSNASGPPSEQSPPAAPEASSQP
jgi:hypothetical protein